MWHQSQVGCAEAAAWCLGLSKLMSAPVRADGQMELFGGASNKLEMSPHGGRYNQAGELRGVGGGCVIQEPHTGCSVSSGR